MSSHDELFCLSMDYASSPELPALKKRFEGFSACKDKATAAAFGYLAAMQDATMSEEEEEEEITVFDEICVVMDQLLDKEGFSCTEEAADLTMGLIYNWLHDQFVEEGFAGSVLDSLATLFRPFVKPGVIKEGTIKE